MSSFPTLIPSSRTFTPGDYPNSPFTALSGLEGRVRHSNVMLGSRLTLGFRSISESDMLGILAHYQAQGGQYAPFSIPSSLLNGVSAAGDYALEDYQWRYVNPPSVTDIPCAGYDVSIELESVPAVGASVISTLQPTVQLLLAPGVAAAANGIAADIGFALDASGAGGNGADLSVVASYADNGATGEASSFGIEKSILFLFTPGTATVPSGLPNIGDAFEGGFFAGLISHTADGNPTHALIVAPRATGASGPGYTITSTVQHKTTNTATSGTTSLFDGAANTAAMVAAGIADHPAAQFCVNLNINGFADWYLPSRAELQIAYTNLKPTTVNNNTTVGVNDYDVPKRTANYTTSDPSQTSVASFIDLGGEDFRAEDHHVSTETGGSQCWIHSMNSGLYQAVNKTFNRSVRAFRRVAL